MDIHAVMFFPPSGMFYYMLQNDISSYVPKVLVRDIDFG